MGGFRATTDELLGWNGQSEAVVAAGRSKQLFVRNWRKGEPMEHEFEGRNCRPKARPCAEFLSSVACRTMRLSRHSALYH